MPRFVPTVLLLILPTLVAAEGPVDFNREIRPLLSKHCTGCHGGVKEAGEISFIDRAKALGLGESGQRPIVPGKPTQSEMVRRMRTIDPDEVMPQPKHGPPLPEEDIALVERWISEGAVWAEHWAFSLPQNEPPQSIADEAWPAVSLDRFVLHRLDAEKLTPSSEAPAAEWLRRVSFDLIGLPPTPEELAAYESAIATDPVAARSEVVNRLLASPHFGERWATVWLDLARFSDTYGFEKDPHRDIWPYRDWVIRAFNADLPYDQFIIEQLAGDLLPDATADQRLATAFHRNTQTNTEGGTDDEEFRVAAVIDRVSTTWTAFQATTFACVQCHSHPYDPIDHQEFYQFLAFFNNTQDHDLDSDEPRMKVSGDPLETAEASFLQVKLANLRNQLNQAGNAMGSSVEGWQRFVPDSLSPSHGTLIASADGTISADGTLPVGVIHTVSGPALDFTALRLTISPESDDPKKWPERGSLVTNFQATLIDANGKASLVPMKEVFADRMGDLVQPSPTGNVGGYPKLEGPRWFVFVPENPVTVEAGTQLQVILKQNGQTTGNQGTPVRKFALDLSNQHEWSELIHSSERAAQWAEYAASAARWGEISGILVPVMAERAPRETRVFARGNRITKADVVTAGVPHIFGGAARESMNRLDMARWIASAENPLTARVITNRLWGELFGLGIVRAMEDFGTSGSAPSHPELLDHLAVRFQTDLHWSIKSLLREIVLSATYRQTHNATAGLVEQDPENRLLARGPRNRLTGEMVRDQSLAVAGVLSPKMYGAPVFPPQPAGVWNSVYSGESWKESTGEDRYRRAIYTYSKRTSGYPALLTFDAPSRDLCSARRIVSNTPLQALITMNDPAHIDTARALAGRMISHSQEPRSQLAYGVLLATQQVATEEMLHELNALLDDATTSYAADPTLAAHLGETPTAAALVLVANTIMNLDSALTR